MKKIHAALFIIAILAVLGILALVWHVMLILAKEAKGKAPPPFNYSANIFVEWFHSVPSILVAGVITIIVVVMAFIAISLIVKRRKESYPPTGF